MRKTKEQKGITLIALIITIIVLLILAVVAIGAVQNDGIINYAKNARQEYGAAQVKENDILQGYLSNIQVHTGNSSTDSDTISFTINLCETLFSEENVRYKNFYRAKRGNLERMGQQNCRGS